MSPSRQPGTAQDVAELIALIASQPDPGPAFRAIEALAGRTIGHTLFTVMRHRAASAQVERVYSSNEAAYPVGGRKRKEGTQWGAAVLDRGEVFLARNPDEVRAAFPDWELILGLGIGAILNVPIRLAGKCIGTLNLCGPAEQYGKADVPTGHLLAGLLVPLLLLPGAAER